MGVRSDLRLDIFHCQFKTTTLKPNFESQFSMISITRLFLASLVAVSTLPSLTVYASPQAELIPERPKSELILPETTVALLQIPNFSDALEKMRETRAGQMTADDSVAPLLDGLWQETETAYEEVREKVGIELSDLTSLPSGEMTFAVIAPRRQNPEYLVLMDLNEEDGALDRVMERGREYLPQKARVANSGAAVDAGDKDGEPDLEDQLFDSDQVEAEPEETEPNEDGFEIEFFYADGRKIHFFRHKGTLVACTSLSELNDLIDRWMGREVEKTRPLTDNRKFVTIMKRCEGTNDLDPEFRFFVDPIAVAKSSTRGNTTARFTINLLPLLGFDTLSAIGGTLFLDEEEYESVLHGHVLLTNPRSGIFALLAFKPTEYTPEEFVPAGVVSHSMISVDAPKAYAELTKIVDSFQEPGYFEKLVQKNVNDEFGLDLKADIMDSIDGRITWFQWAEEPAMVNSIRSGIAIRLKDTESFQLLLDEITERYNTDQPGKKANADNPPPVELRNYRDVTIYAEPRSKVDQRNEKNRTRRNARDRKNGTNRMRMEVRTETPQFAIFGDCLVISANSNELMKVMIDTHLGEGDRLADDENYARIVDESQRLLNNELPVANFYNDPKRQIKWLLELMNADQTKEVVNSAAEQNKYLAGFKRQMEENPLPEFEQLEQYFTQTGGYMSDDDTGLHMLLFSLKSEDE